MSRLEIQRLFSCARYHPKMHIELTVLIFFFSDLGEGRTPATGQERSTHTDVLWVWLALITSKRLASTQWTLLFKSIEGKLLMIMTTLMMMMSMMMKKKTMMTTMTTKRWWWWWQWWWWVIIMEDWHWWRWWFLWSFWSDIFLNLKIHYTFFLVYGITFLFNTTL